MFTFIFNGMATAPATRVMPSMTYSPAEYKLLSDAECGRADTILELLSNPGGTRMDLNCTDEFDRTPLVLASYYGHHNVVQLLIDFGADVNRVDQSGWSSLYAASQRGHLATVQILLDNGADVNSVSKSSSTPLHEASQNGNLSMVQVLVENGKANITCKNYFGSTPIVLARGNRHRDVVNYLKLELRRKAYVWLLNQNEK
jgi:ankyrin repeat protein